jgi:hypothetical protein
MRTRKQLYSEISKVYTCELEQCSVCGGRLEICPYVSGRKTIQTMSGVMRIAYQPKRCGESSCVGYGESLKSGAWQQLAPRHSTYGYDVIATLGWQRQRLGRTYAEVQTELVGQVQISVSEVRYLYTYQYLPLLACHERGYRAELERVATQRGLILSLDGLAPEGGEPQLWVVRELRTGQTLRSGWLSEQGQLAFENFLRPIAELGLRIEAVLSDKQRGLVPAIKVIFPQTPHAFCQSHYLNNLAEPIAEADEAMKVRLRQAVRVQVGELIRPEQVEQAGVLTVTGLLPTPLPEDPPLKTGLTEPATGVEVVTEPVDPAAPERAEMVAAVKRRVRYLLTLKGRPPFRLAGLEMYERLNEVSTCLNELLNHSPHPELKQLQQGLDQALTMAQADYGHLSQAAGWLQHLANLLDPTVQPIRTGAEVERNLLAYLDQIRQQHQAEVRLTGWVHHLDKTTHSYQPGLFFTYDLPDLPRTNNERESEFRRLNQQLFRTTGQKGATRRLIQRSGAWELIPRPGSLAETVAAISTVAPNEYEKERIRVCAHRKRFQLHTRSVKLAQKQLGALKQRWLKLPPDMSSV